MPYKIGETEYSDEQLTQALDAVKQLQELHQKVGPALKMAERYKMDVPTLVENAEGAFDQLFQLQEAGLVDEQGKVIKKTPDPPPTPPTPPAPGATPPDSKSVEAIVAKALEGITTKFTDVSKKVDQLGEYQGRLLRERMLDRVQAKYPSLTEEDISILTAKASSQKKDFWELAEAKSKEKEDSKSAIITNFAKEHNLDLEAINKTKEMRSDEGAIAAAVVEGRKISSKGGENTISPKEAMVNYFKLHDEVQGG